MGVDTVRTQRGGLHILNRAVGAYTLDLSAFWSSQASLDSNGLRQDQSSGEDSQTCSHLLFRTLFLPVSQTIERLNITPPLSFPTHDHTRQIPPHAHLTPTPTYTQKEEELLQCDAEAYVGKWWSGEGHGSE